MPQPLQCWGKNLWYLLDRRLGGHHSHSGCGGGEKKISAPARNHTFVIQSVA